MLDEEGPSEEDALALALGARAERLIREGRAAESGQDPFASHAIGFVGHRPPGCKDAAPAGQHDLES